MRPLAAAALTVFLLAVIAAQAGQAQPAPAPTSTPEPAPVPPAATPSPAPAAVPPTAEPVPTATPAPSPTASASASPYHYVVTPPPPPPGQPVIREIDMLEQTLHPGGKYSVHVYTSPDVTTLDVQAMGGNYSMQAAGAGVFASDGQIPGFIPFFMLDRSYTITVVASTADGKSTSVPITLRLER